VLSGNIQIFPQDIKTNDEIENMYASENIRVVSWKRQHYYVLCHHNISL